MKYSTRFFVGCSLLILVVCYSCGVPSSKEEMKAAQQAMDSAKSLHAEDLAASNWNEAMQTWEQGEAAVKEGKSAKTFFLRAKSRFEKSAAIAKSQRDVLSRDVSEMQLAIGERVSKVKAALEKGKVSSKVQKQIKPIIADVEKEKESLDGLASQGDFLKARTLGKQIQAKIFNAELIMAGKKPVS
jgi:Domain of unknown function (DUF4398)